MKRLEDSRIAIIGLGYVGLPLAVEFGKIFDTIGYDIRGARIAELREGKDSTLECSAAELSDCPRLRFTDQLAEIASCNIYIVSVPTPIDSAKRPDLAPLIKASEAVGSVLNSGDLVVYESTVYPGCTEEVCVPILERASGLVFDGKRVEQLGGHVSSAERGSFSVGYSPERINPGDKQHRLRTIPKVTSGSTPSAADFVESLYARIVAAGTHKTSSIRVAEAAKVIENTQRDLNIALVNDLAILFNTLGIDTLEVLEAAGTKWNFLPFRPGLVGGHCIGVDPYYLTHKAQEVGHHPDVILAGRRTNDGMGAYVANEVIRLMVRNGINPVRARVLVLGLTFKENCPDLRNTRVVDIIHALERYSVRVEVCDPWARTSEAKNECGLLLIEHPDQGVYDAIVLAVGHDQFKRLGAEGVRAYGKPTGSVVYDVKSLLPRDAVDGRL